MTNLSLYIDEALIQRDCFDRATFFYYGAFSGESGYLKNLESWLDGALYFPDVDFSQDIKKFVSIGWGYKSQKGKGGTSKLYAQRVAQFLNLVFDEVAQNKLYYEQVYLEKKDFSKNELERMTSQEVAWLQAETFQYFVRNHAKIKNLDPLRSHHVRLFTDFGFVGNYFKKNPREMALGSHIACEIITSGTKDMRLLQAADQMVGCFSSYFNNMYLVERKQHVRDTISNLIANRLNEIIYHVPEVSDRVLFRDESFRKRFNDITTPYFRSRRAPDVVATYRNIIKNRFCDEQSSQNNGYSLG
jgi:hypothetical protein